MIENDTISKLCLCPLKLIHMDIPVFFIQADQANRFEDIVEVQARKMPIILKMNFLLPKESIIDKKTFLYTCLSKGNVTVELLR